MKSAAFQSFPDNICLSIPIVTLNDSQRIHHSRQKSTGQACQVKSSKKTEQDFSYTGTISKLLAISHSNCNVSRNSECGCIHLTNNVNLLEYVWKLRSVNTKRLGQNDLFFTDNIFKVNFLYEMCCFLLDFLWFLPWDPINNKPALVQMMAWCQKGDKLSFELIMA